LTPPRLTTSARIAAIRAALVRLKEAREHYRLVSADLTAETLRIESARDSFAAAVREFGWQWHDIEAVLDALAPEK
jgi:hypothetical protein